VGFGNRLWMSETTLVSSRYIRGRYLGSSYPGAE
jgi:hypothetical protein